jgi:EAL domain-containing protein (putative c-di-GMP-specific phosphodiesterase class I)
MHKKIKLQPLLEISTGNVYGYEILFNKENELEYPSAECILKNVSTICKKEDKFQLFINMSEKDAVCKDFCKKFLTTLDKMDIDGNRIVLEVNENTNPNMLTQAKQNLSLLRSHDIKIAIDDFGTQYSTLTFIKELPMDIIKIDKKFVQDAPYSKKSRTLLAFCVNVSHDLGCKVVAEGIETGDQFNCVRDSNVDLAQGFLFSALSNSIHSNNLIRKKSTPLINLNDFNFL